MQLSVHRGSRVPVTEQLRFQLELQILSGALAAGQRLPSVRALARQFAEAFGAPLAMIPARTFDGRRGQRVLALETLSDLAHARVFAPPPGPIARLARAFRCWRAASGLA